MPNELIELRRLIADDAHALTFQTFGQYRTALLKAVDALRPQSAPTEDPSALRACLSACERVIEHGGIFEGIDFHALKKGIERGLARAAPTEAGGVAERETFEAIFPDFWSYDSFTDDEGERIYRDDLTQGAWIAWNKLRTLPTPSPAAGAGVAVPNDAFVAAYMAACAGRAPDHNEIGLHYFRAGAALSATPVAAVAQPVAVPLAFIQAFLTLAHNYSLRAEPPDFYDGRAGDAFSNAYRRCGQDLAKLRDMLGAALAASPSCERQDVGGGRG